MILRITALVKVRSVVEVHSDRDRSYRLSHSQIRELGLKVGDEVTSERLAAYEYVATAKRARERALYLLDARDYSSRGMYERLLQGYGDCELCHSIVEELITQGRIDDTRYANELAEYLVCKKGYGLPRAMAEMQRRQVPRELAQEVLEDYRDTMREGIDDVLSKRYGALLARTCEEKSRLRVLRGMQRLGYSYGESLAALTRLCDLLAKEEEDMT